METFFYMANFFALLTLGSLVLLGRVTHAQSPLFLLQANPPATGGTLNYNATSVAVADINADGKLDAIVTNFNPGTLGILLGNGLGGFALQPSSPSVGVNVNKGPIDVALADVNGDGKLDALVSTSVNTLSVLLGNGMGGFTLLPNSPSTGSNNPHRLAVADVNGDGKLDVLTANNSNPCTLGVLLGDGTGNFTFQATSPVLGNNGSANTIGLNSLAINDINGDGKLDIVAAQQYDNSLGILLGDGAGHFAIQAGAPSTGPNSEPLGVALADVNGDGHLDALTANSNSSTLGVLLGNGAGGFTLQAGSPSTGVGSEPNSVALADVNGDGKLDALTANGNSNTLGVLLGNGAGGFTLQASSPLTGGTGFSSLVVGDVNGDGRPDILATNCFSATMGVLLNQLTPLATTLSLAPPTIQIALYPNPASPHGLPPLLTLTGLPTDARAIKVTLLNDLGQTVGYTFLAAARGTARAEVPTAGLAAGLYVLRLAAYDAQGQLAGSLPTQRLSVQ